jgi:hypothetical protein
MQCFAQIYSHLDKQYKQISKPANPRTTEVASANLKMLLAHGNDSF